jgi:hypothetical protein
MKLDFKDGRTVDTELLPERIVARAEGEGNSKDDVEELNIKILWSEGRERDRSVRVGNL